MMLQFEMTAFCTSAIFSGGTSSPRFPRDRMTPLAAAAMDLKLNSAGRASSFAMICRPTPSVQVVIGHQEMRDLESHMVSSALPEHT